ncbi:HTH domain-containing protein [Candidatus Woesearchaeota archaeon]|nr:HTH domain-containing protein [Candidatus Woesearchaeota archaeon]
MRNAELIVREILYSALEKKKYELTQSQLSKELKISLSIVHRTVMIMQNMGAVRIKQRGFAVQDVKKIMYYWASIRRLQQDIIYSTRVEKPVKEIEKLMPDTIVFACYTAYKLLFNDVPADYSEVYVYGDEKLKSRFPQNKEPHNLFVLKKDKHIEQYGKVATIANTFVDLWNLKEWYAKEFVKSMEARLYGVLE